MYSVQIARHQFLALPSNIYAGTLCNKLVMSTDSTGGWIMLIKDHISEHQGRCPGRQTLAGRYDAMSREAAFRL